MAFRTLHSCSRAAPSSIIKRYASTQGNPHGNLVSPILNPLPRPVLGEYRHFVPEATGPKTAPRTTKVTTLPNGLKVATLSSSDIGVSLGLYVGVGPRHESRHTAGSTHFLKVSAFNSNTTKAGYQVVREAEAEGATLNAQVGREHLLFSSEVTPTGVSKVASILSEILHPKLPYHEVVAASNTVKEEIQRVEHDVVASLIESLHRQAYRSKGLGHSVVARDDAVHHINSESLAKFVDSHYTPDNVVFVGVGLDHETLVNSINASLKNATSKKASDSTEPSRYAGGESLVSASGSTHFALAFEGASLRGDVKEALALGVLKHVLGSVLSGINVFTEVGTGVTSRLANAVAANPSTQALSSFSFSYSDSGLFGVYGEVSENPAQLVKSVVAELGKLVDLSTEELNKGKAAFKFAVLEQGEKRTPALEFIGAQVLASGKAVTPEEYAAQIDNLTAADVAHVAKKVFGTRPTFVAVGDVSNLPTADEIKAAIRK